MKCPFCVYERKRLDRLLRHIIERHRSYLPGAPGGVHINGSFMCWCGKWYFESCLHDWYAHVAQSGGIEACMLRGL